MFTLRYAQAVEIADIIIELHDASKRAAAARASRVEGQPGSVPTEIRVVPDASANTLTVTVAPDHLEDLARISELIARLDVDVRPGR